MTYYIITTRKSPQNPNSVEHILGYGVYTRTVDNTNYYNYYDKEEFFRDHYKDDNTYYSWNTHVGGKNDPNATSLLYKREITIGRPFLQSVGDNTKRDNLLELDDC